MAKVRLSTDSTSDLPREMRRELDIPVLPIRIVMGGKEYRDGVDVVVPEFYDMLEKARAIPTTAQVPVEAYTSLFEETWLKGFTDLIHVTLNAQGSGTYQAAFTARDLFYEDHPQAKEQLNIHILDSHNYSMAYGLAVAEGARLARDGASAREVLACVEDFLAHARVLFIPLNLRFVKRSGRVSAAAAFMGDALGLKPIITFEQGESKILAKVRGEAKAIAAMVELCEQERRPGTPYALAYGSNREAFETLLAAAKLDIPPVLEYPLGCVITINAGPNAVGVCYRT